MPALNNPRHEQFAQCVASGLSATQSYIKAGYSDNGASAGGTRLLKDPSVKARALELKQAVTERATQAIAIDKAWVLDQLIGIAKRHRTRQPNAANRALELIGKELGMFIERAKVDHSGSLEFTGSADSLMGRIASIAARARANQDSERIQ